MSPAEVYACCEHCGCEARDGHSQPCMNCRQPLLPTEDQRVARQMAARP